MTSLLHHTVEETQTEQQPLECDARLATRVELFILHQVRVVEADEVGFDALRSLHDDLDPGLEQGGGEVVGGVAGEPEPELRVSVRLTDDLLPDGGEAGEPGGEEVTVLQYHPPSTLTGLGDQFLSQSSLTLTQGQSLKYF